MKKITYTLLVSLLFIGCTQESSSDKTVQAKQVPLVEQINTKENNETNHTSIEEPVTPTVSQEAQNTTSSETFVKEATILEVKNDIGEDSHEENILAEEEEKNITPPPPKSQEELDDEAKAGHMDMPIAEEDSDEIELEKPVNELEDEAANTTDNEEELAEDEAEEPIKSIEEIKDE